MGFEELVQAAAAARANAYAPYSVYQVGAAILGADGMVYTGCNVENASYGATVCAERAALCAMVAAGCLEVSAIAVVTRDAAPPCGICLQSLAEFSPDGRDVAVTCASETGEARTWRLAELVPLAFFLRPNRP